MDNAQSNVRKVAPGQKIQASTINGLIDSIPNLKVFGDGTLNNSGSTWNLTIGRRVDMRSGGQRFRMPFDLSTSNCLSGATELSIQVVRPHLPNAEGGLDDVSVAGVMKFPAQNEVSVWLCELSGELSGQKVVTSSQGDSPAHVQSRRLMWRLLPNGVVAEDLRWAVIGGEDLSSDDGGEVLLDLSSLNWTSESSEVSAQTWNYQNPQEDDLVDIKGIVSPEEPDPEEMSAVSCNVDKWRFLARPEEGGHLHYASLKDVLSSGCIEISATPIETLSGSLDDESWLSGQGLASGDASLMNHFVVVAKYKKLSESWDNADRIWAPNWWMLKRSLDYTPFWLDAEDPSNMRIRRCWLYVGRTFIEMVDQQVNGEATYYVEINTQLPNQPTATIHRVGGQQFPAGRPANTDTLTYYPLWYIPSTVNYSNPAQTPRDLRCIWKLPFYSL